MARPLRRDPNQPADVGSSAGASFLRFQTRPASGLTAVGPVTGRRYRFERPRARVAVDSRDAAAMAAVPSLRQVKGT
jgi:hypothetical protein